MTQQARRDRQVYTGKYFCSTHCRDDVHVLVASKRDAGTFCAQQRQRMPQDET